jgi:hypothetical protein
MKSAWKRGLALLLAAIALTNTGCIALLAGAAGGAAGAAGYSYFENKSPQPATVVVVPASPPVTSAYTP